MGVWKESSDWSGMPASGYARSGFAKQWKQAAAADIANNIRIAHNHKLLHDWFDDAEIPYVILKGSASASYYGY